MGRAETVTGDHTMKPIVTDYRILKALERRGFIETMDGYDRDWTGRRVRNYFVAAGPKLENWYDVFTYKGQDYRIRYFDGCFKPFVTRLGATLPPFV